MELLPAFPDAEDLMLDLLDPLGTVVLATPVSLVPPLIVVRRVGGFSDRITDFAVIQVETYGSTHEQAAGLAESCRQVIIASPATVAGGTSVDSARTVGAPTFVDYGQPLVHRYIATYNIEFRR